MTAWCGIKRLLFAVFLVAVLSLVPLVRLCHMAVIAVVVSIQAAAVGMAAVAFNRKR